MQRKYFTLILLAGAVSGCSTINDPEKETPMIVHSVFFKLKHAKGSDNEAAFLRKAAKLANIPGVGNFQILEETSPKNDFDFGLSMEFADQAAYDGYNNHPDHVAFVQEVWLKEVEAFHEIDYVPYSKQP
jgi:quinol monooxygenase YgiN